MVAISLAGKAIIEGVVKKVGLILLRIILLVTPVVSCWVLRHVLWVMIAEAIIVSRIALRVLVKLLHKVASPLLLAVRIASWLVSGRLCGRISAIEARIHV